MPTHVPHLKDKLQRLYARNSQYGTSELLAAYLGVKPDSIRQWIHTGDRVPDKHLAMMASMYQLQYAWLLLESLDEFHAVLDAHPVKATTPWDILIATGHASDEIRLVACGFRGLARQATETYQVGQPLYIEIDLPGMSPAVAAPCYLLTLIADGEKTECLYPGPNEPARPVAIAPFKLPRGAPEKTYYVTGPRGTQKLIVLLTRFPFEEDIYRALHQKDNLDALIRIGCQLQEQARLEMKHRLRRSDAREPQWLLFVRGYEVD